MDAPFLDSLIFEEPAQDDPEQDAGVDSIADDEFNADDFPAWYRDKVSDTGNQDAAENDELLIEDRDPTGNYPFDLPAVTQLPRRPPLASLESSAEMGLVLTSRDVLRDGNAHLARRSSERRTGSDFS